MNFLAAPRVMLLAMFPAFVIAKNTFTPTA
jgi:hypothetical protein